MIEHLRPYPDYRDSKILWLGHIPSHWDCLPHRALFREIRSQGFPEEQLLSVTIAKGVVPQAALLNDSSKRDSSNEDKTKYKLVEPNDIAYNKMRAWQGAVGMSKYRGLVSPAYIVVRLRSSHNPEYFHYLFRTPRFIKEAERWSYGITSDQWSLRPEHFKMIYSCLPTKDEQYQITRFLTKTDRSIDRFIRNRRRLIKTLNEQKQAMVGRLVTRGLDPDVPLRPSGVEWLGDVPVHWEILRAKYLFKEVDERSSSGTEELLSVSHITGVTPRSQKNITMFMAKSYVGHKICRPGDLVVNTMWAWMKAMGISSQLGIVSPSYAIYRPTKAAKVVGGYFDHLLRTPNYGAEYWRRSTGIRKSRLRLYPDDFLRIPMLVPPRHEQEKIAEYIASTTHNLNSAILNAEREIVLIHEYRTRLVSDVVTGKIDVRGLSLAEAPFLDEDNAEGFADADPTETEDYGIPEEAIDDDE
ncbi:MAG: restriction endonuclease subunit S [Alkalispirochaeta sp.]